MVLNHCIGQATHEQGEYITDSLSTQPPVRTVRALSTQTTTLVAAGALKVGTVVGDLTRARLDWTSYGNFQESRTFKATVRTKDFRNARVKAKELTDVKIKLKGNQGDCTGKG